MIDIPVIDMCKTGQNIVYYRKQQGLSVKDLQIQMRYTSGKKEDQYLQLTI